MRTIHKILVAAAILSVIGAGMIVWFFVMNKPPSPPGCGSTSAGDLSTLLKKTFSRTMKEFASNKTISFFDTWGQQFPLNCDCGTNQDRNCLACYRWTSAIVLWTLAQVVRQHSDLLGRYQKDILAIANQMLKNSPYNDDITSLVPTFFVDDVLWYCQAYLQVYQLSGDNKYLQAAEDIFQLVVSKGCIPVSDGSQECNLVWNTNVCNDGTNCSTTPSRPNTYPADDIWGVVPAVKLYTVTQDTKYLKYATRWLSRLYETQQPPKDTQVYTYTNFLGIYANAMLYQQTKKDHYLNAAKDLYAAVKKLNNGSIVLMDKDEATSDSRQFKTIAMLLFAELPRNLQGAIFPPNFARAQLQSIQENRRDRTLCSYPSNNAVAGCQDEYFTNYWSSVTPHSACNGSSIDISSQCGGLTVLSAIV